MRRFRSRGRRMFAQRLPKEESDPTWEGSFLAELERALEEDNEVIAETHERIARREEGNPEPWYLTDAPEPAPPKRSNRRTAS